MGDTSNPITATGEIAKALAPVIDNFAKLTGPLCEEVGLYFGDKVRAYRQRNLGAIIEGSVKKLEAAGRPVNAVPPRLLLPIIEAASLEENPTIQAMWSGLLASASYQADDMSPSFAETLKLMTPTEARCISVLFAEPTLGERNEVLETIWHRLNEEVDEQFMPDLAIDSFERLGLLRRQYDLHKNEPFFPLTTNLAYAMPPSNLSGLHNNVLQQSVAEQPLPKLTYELFFSYYGVQFMRACQGPASMSSATES